MAVSIRERSETPIELPPFSSLAYSASKSVASLHALRAVRTSGGTALSVPDVEIVAAQAELARTEGLLVEPTAALSIASLRAAVAGKLIDPQEPVVCILTGPGQP